ncbi:MAG TPA: hypothetical protein VGR09_02615 [Gemmatimonadales bacterium]|nr:hypothetical protein [Gemmatimonadales bacterium]
MRRLRSSLAVSCAVIVIAGCSAGTGPSGGPPLSCTQASVRVLAVGEHQVIDPTQDGACVRLPAASGTGAEHLYVPLATASGETNNGVSGPYLVTGGSPVLASARVAPIPAPRLSAFQGSLAPEAFHAMLRARERALSQSPGAALFNQGRISTAAAGPPALNDKRNFLVCATSACTSFVQTAATALSVGQRVAIFVDDSAPSGGYTTPQLDDVKNLFDQFLYPIDTTAFGRESDIDGNGVVVVLLTQHVNALSPDCNNTGRVILGYFFGADLLPRSASNPGSNEAEVFYGLVPDPNNTQCGITQAFARSHLPATFIHEFQHMISYNQHVLVRGGTAEDTWLNEGLSHFAEELGGRQVPDVECPNSSSCFNEFIRGDLDNAFEYLTSPEDFFLIEPGTSTGSLQERGANWLMVRWLADHFAADTILGTDLTHRLDATAQTGGANVAAQTGEDFSKLVGEWQLANYLDDLPGFAEPTARLRYRSWNFRQQATALGFAYPLVPDSTSGVGYNHSGVLRAGSGRHIRVVQAAGAASVDLTLTDPAGAALSSTLEPRVALVRVR